MKPARVTRAKNTSIATADSAEPAQDAESDIMNLFRANPFRRLRQLTQIHGWIRGGMRIPPVPALKRRLISSYLERYNLGTFIETGTFKGDTLAEFAERGLRAISIELSPEYFAKAQKRFAGMGNVELHLGDSAEVLPNIIDGLTKPALFWLDGHYSAGETAHGALASPINGELASILASPVKGHIILIDDAHEFTGQGGYPELGRFLTSVREDGRYSAMVHANVIVMEPR